MGQCVATGTSFCTANVHLENRTDLLLQEPARKVCKKDGCSHDHHRGLCMFHGKVTVGSEPARAVCPRGHTVFRIGSREANPVGADGTLRYEAFDGKGRVVGEMCMTFSRALFAPRVAAAVTCSGDLQEYYTAAAASPAGSPDAVFTLARNVAAPSAPPFCDAAEKSDRPSCAAICEDRRISRGGEGGFRTMATKQSAEGSLRKRKDFRLPVERSNVQLASKYAAKKRRGSRSRIGPCECIAIAIALTVLALYGRRGIRYFRSYTARDYVESWPTPSGLLEKSAAIANREAEALGQKGECQLPRYPDGSRSAPSSDDFARRFWTGSRTACVMADVGTAGWPARDLAASRAALQAAAEAGREWSLHYAHGNATAMAHPVHLSALFEPSDPENAPWAELTVPADPDVLPDHFYPANATRPWKLLIVPVVSGHAPVIAEASFYLVVLAGKVRVITYRTAHAFRINDAHVHDWHAHSLPRVRLSGNHGKSCILKTDEALVLPSGFGYAFLALENAVLLKIDIESGY
ncbi:hypothetical protein DIPPA_04087 [Diplonema papillatum]|nr:hypothetical protein DIPPA_04087 [Diplonema papillatum]